MSQGTYFSESSPPFTLMVKILATLWLVWYLFTKYLEIEMVPGLGDTFTTSSLSPQVRQELSMQHPHSGVLPKRVLCPGHCSGTIYNIFRDL